MTSTERVYLRAQRAFSVWCERRDVGVPDHRDVARYLEECFVTRGTNVAFVHLSALGDLFRARGMRLDTRHEAIQAVLQVARQSQRKERTEREECAGQSV